MLPINRLETPPPASRFRRPWSPEPFDPNPLQDVGDHPPTGTRYWQGYRELSDVSVEALDLADYARTLARHEPRTREPIVFQPYDQYPPSPQLMRPLSSSSSYAPTPALSPSSSVSQSHTSGSPGRSHRGSHRPFSLPVPPRSFHSHPTYSGRSSVPNFPEPDTAPLTPSPEADTEIDITQFPRFARHWYNTGAVDNTLGKPLMDDKMFDPSYPADKLKSFSPLTAADASPYLLSDASHSSRDMGAVPWGDASAEGPPVDEEVKEERIRMLEREFGGKDVRPEVEEGRLVGSVDPNGRLITAGPKKRAATRWIQVLFALLAGGSSIYAALVCL
jgi:hypothetical protein